MERLLLVFGSVVLAATVGCGPSPSSCVPGAQASCACAVGTGLQQCNASGTFDPCMCGGDAGPMLDAGGRDGGGEDDGGPDIESDSGPSSDEDAAIPGDGGLDDATPPSDAGRPDAARMRDAGPGPPCTEELDLLLMVDNSNSMEEEQLSLAVELPRLVRALATGDLDDDGTADFVPIPSIHVGVVSSDMGVGGATVSTCDRGTGGAAFGDDGVLLTRVRSTATGCDASYPPVFAFASGDAPDAFAEDVACVATTGTGGCGFEQQLEAVLKAISPSAPQTWTAPDYVAPTFFAGTSGHADGANSGFVRPGSILGALIVTDEEDCSALEPEVFDPSSPIYGGTDLNLRCFTYPDTQHPIDRYVTGISALRRDPARLVLSVIAGVPDDLSGDTTAEYDAILDDPRMVERVDSEMPTRLSFSCNVPGRGVAFPPRRIVGVASGLDAAGAQTSVESICRSSFAPAIDVLVASVAAAADACP